MMPFLSPLRYPGGKRKLANFIKLIFHTNFLLDGEYAEPYAGGASIALALLFEEYVQHIHINDLDYSIYAFWYSVLNETEQLCRLISDTPVTMDEWYRQKSIQTNTSASLLELGFSTFFLNRTNRSGIISGGVIGGKNQNGKWKLDARYNKKNLIKRIRKIARYRSRISLYNLDALDFTNEIISRLPDRALIYFDPPYFVKGKQLLYSNFYNPHDHKAVAELARNLSKNWIVSYDDVPEIRSLYTGFRCLDYGLHYSTQTRYRGSEIMFFCDTLVIPEIDDPARIKNNVLQQYLL